MKRFTRTSGTGEPPLGLPDNRHFGFTIGGVLVALGGVRVVAAMLRDTSPPVDPFTLGLWAAGSVLIALALLQPAWLALPNRLWHRFGLLLARVVNPVVLFLIYATCIVPVGVTMRVFGHDPLRRKRDQTAGTYWVAHESSPLDKPMRHPF